MKFAASALFHVLLAPTAVGLPASSGLSDPDIQPKFTTIVPNALHPSFMFDASSSSAGNPIEVSVSNDTTLTGLVDSAGTPLETPIWGYGTPQLGYTWPGRTFSVVSGVTTYVKWLNRIPVGPGYLLTGKNNSALGDYTGRSVVDKSFHWAFSIPGYKGYTIENVGTPIIPHLHGGHQDAPYDGNPEFFFTPFFGVVGPQWGHDVFEYDNSQPAGALWYHDHALGITRLNVNSGMAGFYFVRDKEDSGTDENPLGLPAFPYEVALAIQDRMFKETGELFWPAFPGDPFWTDFIEDEGAQVGNDEPSGLAEFFGDHIVVNGKIWPKMEVEPRKYRLRILNGCDSRFMVLQFMAVSLQQTDFIDAIRVPFLVIGGDQGFAEKPTEVETLVFEPAARYDIIFDFADLEGLRIIIKNIGGDEPYGGDIPGPQAFEHTDKVMAFDVVVPLNPEIRDDYEPPSIERLNPLRFMSVDRTRKLGLFEGHDPFGRLQPLLGTLEEATDKDGNLIYWPDDPKYTDAGVTGPMVGTMGWNDPTTENIKLNDVEEWYVYNLTPDAHPVHLHMVNFMVVKRFYIKFDSNANEYGELEPDEAPVGDGTYHIDKTQVMHDGALGEGYQVVNPTLGELVDDASLPEYVENFPRDVVVALPGQVTVIRAKFDKPGRFNWHCHILSHEDHEMMRLYHVGTLPQEQRGGVGPEGLVREDPQPVMCFSGSALVKVKGKGSLPLREASIGDEVLVDENVYEPIYSFGHLDNETFGSYLKFSPSGLEISSTHMVLRDGRAVPASMIAVGDVLSDGRAVTAIEKVRRQGAYAPFTPSGMLIVNGVIVSSFVSLQDTDVLTIGGLRTFVTHQWLAHMFEFPHRLVCHHFGQCLSEEYNSQGLSTWVALPHRIAVFVLKQSTIPVTTAFFLMAVVWGAVNVAVRKKSV